MEKMIDIIFNTKLLFINLAYVGMSLLLFALQATLNYTAALPHPTLAALGLTMACVGGVVSWFWERRKNPRASLRTNIVFALGIGLLFGLFSYDYLVAQNNKVNLWLACLVAAGFSNQMCWGFVAIISKRKISEIFNVEEENKKK